MIFGSIADARTILRIPEEIRALYLKEHPDSIERMRPDGQVIKVIGKGILRSPGLPGGNQCIESQRDLIRAFVKQVYLPLFMSDSDQSITYMGNYYLARCEKKLTFAGFAYFEFTIHRCRRSPPWRNPSYENNPINTEGVDETDDLIEEAVREYSSVPPPQRVCAPLIENRSCLPACRFNPWK